MSAHRTEIGRFVFTLEPLPELERLLALERFLGMPGVVELARKPRESRTVADLELFADRLLDDDGERVASLTALFATRSTCNGGPLDAAGAIRNVDADFVHWLFWCLRVTFGSIDRALDAVARNATSANRKET